jgi:hypothetical protein
MTDPRITIPGQRRTITCDKCGCVNEYPAELEDQVLECLGCSLTRFRAAQEVE